MKIKLHTPEIPNGLLKALESKQLEYSSPETLFHLVWIDGDHYCGVFGDGANAAYEWFDLDGGKLRTSDCGYGDDSIALRDALCIAVSFPTLNQAHRVLSNAR